MAQLAVPAILWIAFSGLAAAIAQSRGRSAGGWFAVSMLLSPLFGLVGVLGLPSLQKERQQIDPLTTPWHGSHQPPVKACPSCHGSVHAASTVCILCNRPFPSAAKAA